PTIQPLAGLIVDRVADRRAAALPIGAVPFRQARMQRRDLLLGAGCRPVGAVRLRLALRKRRAADRQQGQRSQYRYYNKYKSTQKTPHGIPPLGCLPTIAQAPRGAAVGACATSTLF